MWNVSIIQFKKENSDKRIIMKDNNKRMIKTVKLRRKIMKCQRSIWLISLREEPR